MTDNGTDTEIDTWHMVSDFKGSGGPVSTGCHVVLVECLRGPNLPVLREGALSLELEDDVTSGEANDLVQSLNRMVRFMTYTGPVKPEFAGQIGRSAIRKIQPHHP